MNPRNFVGAKPIRLDRLEVFILWAQRRGHATEQVEWGAGFVDATTDGLWQAWLAGEDALKADILDLIQ